MRSSEGESTEGESRASPGFEALQWYLGDAVQPPPVQRLAERNGLPAQVGGVRWTRQSKGHVASKRSRACGYSGVRALRVGTAGEGAARDTGQDFPRRGGAYQWTSVSAGNLPERGGQGDSVVRAPAWVLGLCVASHWSA